MDALKELLPLVIAFSLGLLVFVVGLDSKTRDLTYVLRSPKRLAKAMLAVNVLTPGAAILLVQFLDIGSAARVGVLLMAISPAPPLIPGKALKLSGQKQYAYGLYVALIVLAVVVVPVSVWALGKIYGVELAIPPFAVARNVVLTVVLPLAIGVVVRRAAPVLAARAAPLLYKGAMGLLLLAIVPLVVRAWPAMSGLAGDGALLVMAAVIALATAIGALIGRGDPDGQAALAAAAATRHPGLAVMIAKGNAADPQVIAAILAFLLIGLVVAIPAQAILKRVSAGAPQGPSVP